METSVVITSTDKSEIAKILGFLATETDITKTKYAVTNDLKGHVAKICDPSPTPALHNDFKDLRIVPCDVKIEENESETQRKAGDSVTEELASEDELETGEWAKKYDRNGSRYLKCRECETYVENEKKAEMHSIIFHTNLKKYECPVEGCERTAQFKIAMSTHYETSHPNNSCDLKTTEWTSEEQNIYQNAIKTCFPELGTKNFRNTCQSCNEVMVKNSDTERRIHSICHLKLKLYKCNEPYCKFKTVHPDDMKVHGLWIHEKSIVLKDMKIKLTENRELKIASTMKKCFPEG